MTRRFGDVTAVDGLSLALEPGEFVTLLGPSGCGKTTALRLLAGFEQVDEGRLLLRGEEVTGWSPQRRGFGMVFQNYALFPHLNVFENVAFGLRSRKTPGVELRTRVDRALARVDLAGYAERAVQALSGGQQQRVALARALAIEPPLLLLDEPLSNLDQALRVRTRGELRDLVRELGMTALFVTHDQEEAFDLSDRIAVMNGGRLRQVGTPRALYESPADRFVAGFVGRVNEVPAEVVGDRARVAEGVAWPVRRGGGAGATAASLAATDSTAAGPTRGYLLVRPEALRMVEAREEVGSDLAALRGRVLDRRFGGPVTIWRVMLEGRGHLSATLEVVAPSGGHPDPHLGDEVGVVPRKGSICLFFPREEEV